MSALGAAQGRQSVGPTLPPDGEEEAGLRCGTKGFLLQTAALPRLRQAGSAFWGGFHAAEPANGTGDKTRPRRGGFSCPKQLAHLLLYIFQQAAGRGGPIAEAGPGRHKSPSNLTQTPQRAAGDTPCPAPRAEALEEFSGRPCPAEKDQGLL